MKNILAVIALVIKLFSCALVYAEEGNVSKFKVGILIPLSGMAAEFGTAIRNGASLAIEDNKDEIGTCEFIK